MSMYNSKDDLIEAMATLIGNSEIVGKTRWEQRLIEACQDWVKHGASVVQALGVSCDCRVPFFKQGPTQDIVDDINDLNVRLRMQSPLERSDG